MDLIFYLVTSLTSNLLLVHESSTSLEKGDCIVTVIVHSKWTFMHV